MTAFIPLTERLDFIALIDYEEKYLALLNVRLNNLLEKGLIRRHGAVIRLDDPQCYIEFRKNFAVQLCVFAIAVFVLANTRDIHQSNFFAAHLQQNLLWIARTRLYIANLTYILTEQSVAQARLANTGFTKYTNFRFIVQHFIDASVDIFALFFRCLNTFPGQAFKQILIVHNRYLPF